MQKIKDILRLKYSAQLSVRQIALGLALSVGVVSKYLNRAKSLGWEWPLPAELSDAELATHLQPGRSIDPAQGATEPDFAVVQTELKTKGQQLSMRQVHRAGEKLFIDYCGPTLSVVNPSTGEVRSAQVFVAVLGASSYTYAEATWSQTLPDWIGSHVRALAFFGGTPQVLVPDNLKSAVTKACRYDPYLNPAYQQMAEHYGVAVIPARPYKPKDKAKVEVGVQVVERWIMMRLRQQTFFTLAALNQVIRLLLEDLNQRPFKKRPGSLEF